QTSQIAGSVPHPAFSGASLPEPLSLVSHVPFGHFAHRPASHPWIATNGSSIQFGDPARKAVLPAALEGVVAFESSLPSKDTRRAARDLLNPFQDNAVERIPALSRPRTLENGEVNGYIKCRFHGMRLRSPPRTLSTRTSNGARQASQGRLSLHRRGLGLACQPRLPTVAPHALAKPTPKSYAPTTFKPVLRTAAVDPPSLLEEHIQRLPHDFGQDLKLSPADWQFFVFYRNAWCSGRAILDATNCWLVNIIQMAPRSQAVLHAMLALAGTYVLDYLPDERVRQRSNAHYNAAVGLLTKDLREEAEQRPGGGESIVAAIALLNMLDVVSPERRRSKKEVPRWLEGAQVACKVLDVTDPGHRYWHVNNVQPSDARVANTVITSRAVVLALPMTRLNKASSDSTHFQWLLLQSTEENSRKIHGACGCAPRLLHRFALITHLAALIEEEPESIVLPVGADAVAEELNEFRQWSELNRESHSSVEALLRNCDLQLNPQGIVTNKASMTDLTAEAWRLAAIIYLHCRLSRLPRSHPDVVKQMTYLAACIRRMPTSGPLFTAQAPFFPVFLLGLLAVHPDHKLCAEGWFQSVIRTSCRSSVPPAYEALQRIRDWMKDEIVDDDVEIPESIALRSPWWETMVARVTEEEGILCLI
ncbi:hypothetical protein VD0002_g10098, partial [Verticillium dahliae]